MLEESHPVSFGLVIFKVGLAIRDSASFPLEYVQSFDSKDPGCFWGKQKKVQIRRT